MQAYTIREWGGIDKLHQETIEKPEPKANEVVVRVKAIGLNPIDYILLEGAMKESLALPAIVGSDISGVIEAVGSSVTALQVGDEVMGLINFPGTDGTIMGRGYAEFVAVPASQVVTKPKELSFTHAAALPAVGLTARQALHDVAQLQAGQSILIHGAGGGVGHIAVQLAHRLSAHVIATARTAQHTFVKQLGAQNVIDYTQVAFEDEVKNMDVVFDTVGGEVMRRSLTALKPQGVLVTTQWPEIDAVQDEAKAKNVNAKAVTVHPSKEQLTTLAQLAANDSIKVHVDTVYLFKDLPEALMRLKTGGIQGKLVVEMDS